MLPTMEIVVSPLPGARAGDDVLLFWNRYAAQAHTFERAVGPDELRIRVLHPGGDSQRQDWWLARRAGEVVGLAYMERMYLDEHHRDVEIDLLLDPDAGTGVARAPEACARARPRRNVQLLWYRGRGMTR